MYFMGGGKSEEKGGEGNGYHIFTLFPEQNNLKGKIGRENYGHSVTITHPSCCIIANALPRLLFSDTPLCCFFVNNVLESGRGRGRNVFTESNLVKRSVE